MTRPLCVAPTCWSRGHHLPTCSGDCDGCSPRLALDGLRLCGYHTDHIGTDAAKLADLHAEIGIQLGASGTGAEKTSGTKDPGLRINERAVEVRAEIRHVLVGWTRLIAEERAFQLPDDSIAAIGAFVATSATWLAATDYADEASTELRELVGRAWGIAYPSGVRRFQVKHDGQPVPCPMTADDQPCPGTLWTILRRTDSLLPSALACDVHEDHQIPADRWLTLGRQLRRAA